jgi:TIR domain
MQVFICWSGKASHNIAEALKTFLEDTIQGVQPFLSSESIQKGGRWLAEVSGHLSTCNFGILCLTKENLSSRWMLFEAGALSKDSAEGRVTALLTGIEASDVEAPLSQFQHTGIDRPDILKLLTTINSLVPEPSRRTEAQLARAFDKSWPDLEREFSDAGKLKPPVPAPPARDNESIMKEMLELLRGLARDAEMAKLAITPALPLYQYGQQISPALLDTLTNGIGGPTGPTGPVFVSGSEARFNTGILSAASDVDFAKSIGTRVSIPTIKAPKT